MFLSLYINRTSDIILYMAKSLKKLEALKLRRLGMSIKEIAETISIARSTVSVWCNDVILSKNQKDALYNKMVEAGHKGRIMGAEANKNKKLEVLESVRKIAAKEITSLSKRDIQMLALGLYWGEGSKGREGKFVFVNSDPGTVLLIIKWLQASMSITREVFHPQIYINNQHKERESLVTEFWSKKLKIPKIQFGKTIFIKTPHKKIYENHDTYMGVLHLTVSKSSYLKYKTMAFLHQAQMCVQK